MSFDSEWINDALKELYFQHLMNIRDEMVKSSDIDPMTMIKLKEEMSKTGFIDGYIQKWKDK